MGLQRTLSIIKPDAVSNKIIGEILNRFEKSGLRIIMIKMLHLTEKEAINFYLEHKNKTFFKTLISFMISDPIVIQVLEGENAIFKTRELIGVTDPSKAAIGTIRADFATSINNNAIHGSDSEVSAKREISYFFSSREMI